MKRKITLLFALVVTITTFSQVTWEQTQHVFASDNEGYDTFGRKTALYGDYAVVSAFQEDEDENGENTLESAGAVYVFKKNNEGIWEEIQKIVEPTRGEYHYFGYGLDLYEDYLVVSNQKFNSPSTVYIYKLENEEFVFDQELDTDDSLGKDTFGRRIKIFEDKLFISDIWQYHYYKMNEDSVWEYVKKIDYPSKPEKAIAIDGNYMMIKDNLTGGSDDQLIYVYTLDEDITHVQTLESSYPETDDNNHKGFGERIQIEGDYAIIKDVVGATVFKNENGTWTEMQKLTIEEADANFSSELLGLDSHIHQGRIYLGYGAYNEVLEDGNFSDLVNKIYVYELNDENVWEHNHTISNENPVEHELYTNNMDFYGDTMMLGVWDYKKDPIYHNNPNDDPNVTPDKHGVYFFKINDPNISVEEHITQNTFKIYPNPVDRILKIETDISLKEVSLFDVLGKEYKLEVKDNQVDVSNLETGIYTLKIDDSKNQKIMIK